MATLTTEGERSQGRLAAILEQSREINLPWIPVIVIVVLTYIQFRLSLRWVHYGGQ